MSLRRYQQSNMLPPYSVRHGGEGTDPGDGGGGDPDPDNPLAQFPVYNGGYRRETSGLTNLLKGPNTYGYLPGATGSNRYASLRSSQYQNTPQFCVFDLQERTQKLVAGPSAQGSSDVYHRFASTWGQDKIAYYRNSTSAEYVADGYSSICVDILDPLSEIWEIGPKLAIPNGYLNTVDVVSEADSSIIFMFAGDVSNDYTSGRVEQVYWLDVFAKTATLLSTPKHLGHNWMVGVKPVHGEHQFLVDDSPYPMGNSQATLGPTNIVTVKSDKSVTVSTLPAMDPPATKRSGLSGFYQQAFDDLLVEHYTDSDYNETSPRYVDQNQEAVSDYTPPETPEIDGYELLEVAVSSYSLPGPVATYAKQPWYDDFKANPPPYPYSDDVYEQFYANVVMFMHSNGAWKLLKNAFKESTEFQRSSNPDKFLFKFDGLRKHGYIGAVGAYGGSIQQWREDQVLIFDFE